MNQRYTITIEITDRCPDGTRCPIEQKVKHLLKDLGRRHGIRCVSIEEAPVSSDWSAWQPRPTVTR